MESNSKNAINSDKGKLDIKLEIKEEPNGTSTQVNSQYKGFETVFVSSHFVKESPSDSEMCNKIEIKEEPCWPESAANETEQELELPSAADADLKNEMKKMPTSVDEVAPTELQRSISEAVISEGSNTSSFCTTASWEAKASVKQGEDSQHSEDTNSEDIIKPYKCDICEKSFRKKSNLRRHNLIHEGKKQYNCEVCEKSFQRSSNLKQHFMLHEGIRPHKCAKCGRNFIQLEHLNRHKVVHVDETPHMCEICGKSFTQAGYLNRHSVIHEEKRPYKCEICGKGFKQNAHLKGHSFIHEGKRPYKCEMCKMRFQRSSNLKKHIMIHEGIKPHKCEICDRSFYLPWDLRRHKGVHEKPHKCDVCGKSYRYSSELRKHQLMIHIANNDRFAE